MAPGESLLREPIAPVARSMVRRQLALWESEAQRLGNPEDVEATHDYRVALRRLRTLLRAFRPWLGPIPVDTRRRLRRVMRATNDVRDLEVLVVWIGRQTGTLTPTQQRGTSWLADRLSVRRAGAEARMLARIARRTGSLRVAKLRRALAKEHRTRPGNGASQTAAGVLARLVRREAREIEQGLGSFRAMGDRAAIHGTRIAVKRLRYLLEPFTEPIPGGPELLARLRSLQDQLGIVTDAHAAADELRLAMMDADRNRSSGLGWKVLPWPGPEPGVPAIPPPSRAGVTAGLAALARRLRREGDAAFEHLRSNWLGVAKKDLLEEIRDLARRIPRQRSGRPDLNRRLPAPKAGALPG